MFVPYGLEFKNYNEAIIWWLEHGFTDISKQLDHIYYISQILIIMFAYLLIRDFTKFIIYIIKLIKKN